MKKPSRTSNGSGQPRPAYQSISPNPEIGEHGFHSGPKFWVRKERECSTWWYASCVIQGSNPDQLSVPCAMFRRCMYASQRVDYTAEELEVLDAWAHKNVCLIGYSPAHAPDCNPEHVFG